MKLTTRSTRTYAFDMRRTSATTSTTTQLLQRAYLTASPSPSIPVYTSSSCSFCHHVREIRWTLFISCRCIRKKLLFSMQHTQLCMESSPRLSRCICIALCPRPRGRMQHSPLVYHVCLPFSHHLHLVFDSLLPLSVNRYDSQSINR